MNTVYGCMKSQYKSVVSDSFIVQLVHQPRKIHSSLKMEYTSSLCLLFSTVKFCFLNSAKSWALCVFFLILVLAFFLGGQTYFSPMK